MRVPAYQLYQRHLTYLTTEREVDFVSTIILETALIPQSVSTALFLVQVVPKYMLVLRPFWSFFLKFCFTKMIFGRFIHFRGPRTSRRMHQLRYFLPNSVRGVIIIVWAQNITSPSNIFLYSANDQSKASNFLWYNENFCVFHVVFPILCTRYAYYLLFFTIFSFLAAAVIVPTRRASECSYLLLILGLYVAHTGEDCLFCYFS